MEEEEGSAKSSGDYSTAVRQIRDEGADIGHMAESLKKIWGCHGTVTQGA